MSEFMPNTVSKNVMVGIPRSDFFKICIVEIYGFIWTASFWTPWFQVFIFSFDSSSLLAFGNLDSNFFHQRGGLLILEWLINKRLFQGEHHVVLISGISLKIFILEIDFGSFYMFLFVRGGDFFLKTILRGTIELEGFRYDLCLLQTVYGFFGVY